MQLTTEWLHTLGSALGCMAHTLGASLRRFQDLVQVSPTRTPAPASAFAALSADAGVESLLARPGYVSRRQSITGQHGKHVICLIDGCPAFSATNSR